VLNSHIGLRNDGEIRAVGTLYATRPP